MSAPPTLSIVICNYNFERTLGQAIDAVVTQSCPPDEFIIIDDGSTDGSRAIISTYAAKFPYIRYIPFEKNRGIFEGLKEAVSQLRTTYTYFGAADDYILPGFIETSREIMNKHPDIGVILSDTITLMPDGQEIEVENAGHVYPLGPMTPEKVCACFMADPLMIYGASGSVYNVRLLKAIGGFRKELGSSNDVFACMALGLMQGAFYSGKTGAVWRKNIGGLSQTFQRDVKKSLRMIDRSAQLMVSKQFSPYFPRELVRHWYDLNREHMVKFLTANFRRREHARGDKLVQYLYHREGVWKKLSYLFDGVFSRIARRRISTFERKIRQSKLSLWDE